MVKKTAKKYLSLLLILATGLAILVIGRSEQTTDQELAIQVIEELRAWETINLSEIQEPVIIEQEPEIIEQAPERKVIIARVTAYAPFDNKSGICADENPSVTSVGYRPGSEYVAVDPKRIPYGTKLMIPDYGEVIAGDTGGALRAYDGSAIDVFMDTYAEAMAWGVQYLEVEILESEE